jgi:hypothetical protein
MQPSFIVAMAIVLLGITAAQAQTGRVSERMCKQVSVSLPYRGASHDDRHDDYT